MNKPNNPAINTPKHKRLIDDDTPFAIREAVNQLRTNILYTPNDMNGCPVYATTSAEMSVGKSTITANVALSFAALGKKVLIVDSDMRRPALHELFGINKRHTGLSELLSGLITDDKEVIVQYSPELSIITSGAVPSNPAALMLGKRIVELINKWRQEYDIVFIDLPPMGLVTDPLTIYSHINGYIFVATINKSNSKGFTDSVEKLQQVGAKIVGVVINEVPIKVGGYHGKKYYEYHHYE